MGKIKRVHQPIRVQGWDVSLNHGAFVELINGDFKRAWFVTNTKANAKRYDGNEGLSIISVRVPPSPKDRLLKDAYDIERLDWWRLYLEELVDESRPTHVGIEGYAMGASMHAHQIGEVGGQARLACWQIEQLKLRVHDPMSVKMFTAHHGHAEKEDIKSAVLERWGLCFDFFDPPRSKPTKKNPNGTQNTFTSEDLADAFAIAKLVWYELCLRNGRMTMDQLHTKEIQVFNRVSNAWPVNILGREWIERR